MAPLHHHFEMGGWSEVKLFGVFSGITLIACLLAFWGIIIAILNARCYNPDQASEVLEWYGRNGKYKFTNIY